MNREPGWGRINETQGNSLKLVVGTDHPAFRSLIDKLRSAFQNNLSPQGVGATLLLRIDNYSLMLPFDLRNALDVDFPREGSEVEFIFEAGKLSGDTIYMVYRNDIERPQ